MHNRKRIIRILLALLCLPVYVMAIAAEAFPAVKIDMKQRAIPGTEAMAFTRGLKAGWNLGNTFDAADCDWLSDPMRYETAWCGIQTTSQVFALVKDAGFGAVRIPVSWHNHVSGSDFAIDTQWLARVREVAGYALEQGLYVILNSHHDTGTAYIYPDREHLENSAQYVRCIWRQLAEAFRDVDEHLIFEGMNEPRLVGTDLEWYLNPGDARSTEAVQCINVLNQVFVDAVRASGGYNATRYLMVPGYGASLAGALHASFVLPSDGAGDRLILSVHAYTPYDFALRDPAEANSRDTFDAGDTRDRADIEYLMDQLYRRFIQNGIPVVLGEFGARDKGGNLQARADYAAFFTASAAACGIPCFIWDNAAFSGDGELFGLLDREKPVAVYPEMVNSIIAYSFEGMDGK